MQVRNHLAAAAATSLFVLANSTGAFAETIVYSDYAGTSVSNGYADFDLNGDGMSNIDFYAFDYATGTQEGGVGTYSYALNGDWYVTSIVTEFDNTALATVAVGFDEGDTIDANSGEYGGGGELYVNGGGTPYGILAATGSSAYLGFRIERFDDAPNYEVPLSFSAAVEEIVVIEPVPLETWYGWIEVERGSVILGDYGLQNVSGAAAVIPSTDPGNGSKPGVVPLPAGLPLLLAGLGAFGIVRRRG